MFSRRITHQAIGWSARVEEHASFGTQVILSFTESASGSGRNSNVELLMSEHEAEALEQRLHSLLESIRLRKAGDDV